MTVKLNHLQGQRIGVVGLARSGLATVRSAIAGGANVLAWDDRESARDAAAELGARIAEPEDWAWPELSSLVLAPGIPLTHPEPHKVVGLAANAAVEIISDIELLWREVDARGLGDQCRFVAITGTNGKSTTTALIGHVLAEAGMRVSVGGNIGRSALDLDDPADDRIYVLEMSSYQLDLTVRFRPHVAVWLNLTPDHLDRHGDMTGYRLAKERIFANMGAHDTAVLGIDEPVMEDVAARLVEWGVPILETVSVEENEGASFFVNSEGRLIESGEPSVSFAPLPTLRGRHNWQNAACAYGAVRALGLTIDQVMTGMQSFPGLAHRMEVVGRRGRVLIVNDSKATNADATAKALATFEPIYWIAGGVPKAGGIADLAEFFPRIAKAYLIGQAAEDFSATLSRKVPHVIAGDLQTAVRLAADDAALDEAAEPVILLSPACASFDQFPDFEARGDAFRQAVNVLDRSHQETSA
ncbi:UDP-N-acetylmuramoylalanine--D-glutamate ligase [Faunimonas pinastri]|uniref:UDP-N-acetylmuramoylalanine--D-glutamate ligase n=1 Tax=Faunimonas pinastri TaxID=1855383 RepID=A0A1H9FRE9_9HYPH|nr:UDP-N-acetylmuramoyl-L-alanine--D-glutamate ligase [Faunimonas pinastri]SEQ40500.1 UDP-N-acetylmuramoylalanine--D-glutamate ligase [Faunimonas pinastri]